MKDARYRPSPKQIFSGTSRVHLKRERLALRLIGIGFIALVIYIMGQLLYTLITRTNPAPSVGGILWIAATFLAMLLLAFGKRVTGQKLHNEVLLTEGRVTLVDAYLAGAVLLGILLNALFGWWWADPGCARHRLLWHSGSRACAA